jgi:hypothetical protein
MPEADKRRRNGVDAWSSAIVAFAATNVIGLVDGDPTSSASS